jgi:hypothetical protein
VGRYHLSTIEGFFSTIKRAVIGQYHQISAVHLQSYMDEIAFKAKYRFEDGFNVLISNTLHPRRH